MSTQVAAKARLVVARVLGGRGYWPYGVERLAALARASASYPELALLPGDDQPDAELAALSTVPAAALHRLWRYLAEGGAANAEQFLRYAASLAGRDGPLARAGSRCCAPGFIGRATACDARGAAPHWRSGAPVAALVFYRALVQAANTAPVDALVAALAARGLNPLPLFAASLKDPQSAAIIAETAGGSAARHRPQHHRLRRRGAGGEPRGALRRSDCPVLQVIFAGGDRAAWAGGARGLDPRDIAMNVALPEVDGRIVSRAVSFKAAPRRDALTEADLAPYEPVADRIAFVADLARNWTRLRRARRRPSGASCWCSPTIPIATAASAMASGSTRRLRPSRCCTRWRRRAIA